MIKYKCGDRCPEKYLEMINRNYFWYDPITKSFRRGYRQVNLNHFTVEIKGV